MGIHVNKIAVYLNSHLSGNIFDKDSILEAYSTDRSVLKIKPRFVAIPETVSDIRKIVRFVHQLAEKDYKLPIAVRGSGLSKTGSDLSSGIVISTEKLDHVLEFDAHDRLIHIEAGLTLGKLKAILAGHGLTLPVEADPNETIGGLIANAPRDNLSKQYGGITTYVDRVEFVLPNGDLVQTSKINQKKLLQKKKQRNQEGEIYEKIDELINDYAEQISEIPINSHVGYPYIGSIRKNQGRFFDLLPVLYGSEGTLAIITEVILHVDVIPPREDRIFALFSNYKSADEFISFAEKLSPRSIMLYDARIFKTTEESGKKPSLLTRKFEDGYIVLVSFAEKPNRAKRKIKQLSQFLPKSAYMNIENQENSSAFDEFESCICSYLNCAGKAERPNIIHDFSVPASNLPYFLEELTTLEKKYKRNLEIYGCRSTENYSLRPEFDLSDIEERRNALNLLREVNELIIQFDGCIAHGLPEGRLKPAVLYPKLQENQKKIYAEIKEIFDDKHILSQESKTDYDTRSAVRHLRTEPLNRIDS